MIRYTLNGSDPTPSDPSIASGGAITIARNVTLKAKAWSGSETSPTATAVYHLTGDVAAGSHHVLGLGSSGALVAWGEQASGRLGNGSTATGDVPVPGPSKYGSTSPITDAIAIGAGQNHSLFIKKDTGAGNWVWAFGNNGSGQLGNNSTTNSGWPVRVLKGTSPTDYLINCRTVRCGDNFSGALGADGKVYMWGSQGGGRLGNGSTLGTRKYAVNAQTGDSGNPHLAGIASLSLGGGFALAREACALEGGTAGHVWSWGQGAAGRLGQGSTANKGYAYKVKLNTPGYPPLTQAWDASAGGSHGVVVRWSTGEPTLQGSVWTFGDGAAGRLGNNSTSNSLYPVQVVKDAAGTKLAGIRMVAAGSAHTLALHDDGTVWAWGYNEYGAIGNDDSPNNALYAVQVKNPTGSGVLGDSVEGKIVWIAAGGDGSNNTSYAISERGKIYAWGRNDDGELGNGTNTGFVDRPAPVPGVQVVPGYPDVALTHLVNQPLAPGNVTLTADPTDPDGAADIDKVQFYSQGVLVGQATASPWQFVLSGLAAGNYHVYAVVTDDGGNQGQSSPMSFTISPSDPNSDDDHDGLTHATEGTIGTNPQDADHDNDGMGDGYEHYYGLAPLAATNGLGSQFGPGDDKDGDGMSNKDEADRGRIPVSNTESPAITGVFPASNAKWFGVEGVTYHFEYSSDQSAWNRHPVSLLGDNAELSLQISAVVSPLPSPFHTRLVTVSDAPEVTLAFTVTDSVAPGAVTLAATPTDPDGAQDIESVQFLLGTNWFEVTAHPWTLSRANLAAGSYQARAIVTDSAGKRGFSGNVSFSITSPPPLADEDLDGMPDEWELAQFGTLDRGASDDEDGDFVSNSAEYTNGTGANNLDSDGDGIPDGNDGTPTVPNQQNFLAPSLLVISPLR